MPIFNETSTEHTLKRWMRPDAHRFLRPDWRRFWKPGHENDPLYRLYESIERKYDPAQPRVPAGVPEGGQWTSEDGGSGDESLSTQAQPESSTADNSSRTQVAAKISAQREQECEEMRRNDEFICKAFKSQPCYTQAYLRYSNCLSGRPIPRLIF